MSPPPVVTMVTTPPTAALLALCCLLGPALALPAARPGPAPVRFMCDICEGNFVSCMVHCSLEQFITRDQFDR